MAADLTAEEVIDALRAAFEQRIRVAMNWMPAHEALQLADALCALQLETLAGMRVLYRALAPVDGDAVTEDWRRGKVLSEVMSAHKISRTTAYKYHPNRVLRRG